MAHQHTCTQINNTEERILGLPSTSSFLVEFLLQALRYDFLLNEEQEKRQTSIFFASVAKLKFGCFEKKREKKKKNEKKIFEKREDFI